MLFSTRWTLSSRQLLTSQFFQSSWTGVPVFLQKGLQKLFSLTSWNQKLFAFLLEWQHWVEKILELHLTPLKPLCCHHLPSRADFSFRICLICTHFFLSLYFLNLYIHVLFQKSLSWMISGHNYTFFCPWVFQGHLLYTSWISFGFPQPSFFNLTTFRSCFPSSFYSIFSDDVSSTKAPLPVFPLLQHCLSSVAVQSLGRVQLLWPHGLQEACVSVLGQLYLCALEIFLTTLTCQLLSVFRNCS